MRMQGQSFVDPALLPEPHIESWRKGETIYDPQSGQRRIFMLLEGLAKILVLTDEGLGIVQDFVRPGQYFGLEWLSNEPYMGTAVCLLQSRALSWDAEALKEVMERNPKVAMGFVCVAALAEEPFGRRFLQASALNSVERLPAVLVELAFRLGSPQAEGVWEMPSLTHQDLAYYMGTTREIVTFQMNRLRRQGLIRYDRRRLMIYMDALRDYLREIGVDTSMLAEDS